ncbi:MULTISPECIES: MoaD/ThiS family protein [Dyadobacter]|jgi:molybdopterin synthase sulfur carrier subunit|uniref:MoaD/ThiS family protein n=1 Tax=Dyadobacter chenhuakuii TaxID=2909339 RepID=A0A9X1QJT3_9BACT|nr:MULTISPECIES: MoaD/ThiS family protein [Dyadobacter]MCF2496482.1 MoaD/ThiS family protein [Dyadobacter chenhuakuii]MCF2501528.1 MoaD/ThiS family protein [Dyadobacter chenhuakuii]MCF2519350.1 MoaD/ThiS family protein [Dyadobacter sp. CY351]USJ30539.1 MoaD/ThiS family protein [Dyadobacter chenhuakuii]
MSIQVSYYGMLAEITGQANEVWVADQNLTVGDFRNQIIERYPAMREKKFKIAVDQKIAQDYVSIDNASEIALLPPFAGG